MCGEQFFVTLAQVPMAEWFPPSGAPFKCFEKRAQSHIIGCLQADLDPFEFANKAERFTEDSVITTLHTALTHLEQQGGYARMLFVDFSSAFNGVLPRLGVQTCSSRSSVTNMQVNTGHPVNLLLEGQAVSPHLH